MSRYESFDDVAQPISTEVIEAYEPRSEGFHVVHIKETFTHIIKRLQQKPEEIIGHPTLHWHGFNRAFGGARGELICVTADTNVGKSTFARNWLLDTVEYGRKACLVSLEDSIGWATECLAQMIVKKDIMQWKEDDLATIAQSYAKFNLWYLDHSGPIKEQFLYKMLRYCIDELGVTFFVIDHLDYIEKHWSGRNESYVIGDTMRRLAGVAHKYAVTIVLMVHPAATGQKGVGTREVGIDELKGSSSIKQESDAIFGLFRPEMNVAEVYLRFLKIRGRFHKSIYGKIKYGFDPNSMRYYEVTGELEYGI